VVASSATPTAKNDFMFLGSRVEPAARGFEERDYYVSFNSKDPVEARGDCEKAFNGKGDLVAFESVQEMKDVNKYLDQHGASFQFWTSGSYEAPTKTFFWQATTEDLTPGVRAYLKNANAAKPLDQIWFVRESSRSFHLELHQNSNPAAFICEVSRAPVEPGECDGKDISIHSDVVVHWDEASAYCCRIGKRLVEVRTVNKRDCVQALIRSKGIADGSNVFWLNGRYHTVSGRYEWLSTHTPIDTPFIGGVVQPDRNGDCVSLRIQYPGQPALADYTLDDYSCGGKFSFLCEAI